MPKYLLDNKDDSSGGHGGTGILFYATRVSEKDGLRKKYMTAVESFYAFLLSQKTGRIVIDLDKSVVDNLASGKQKLIDEAAIAVIEKIESLMPKKGEKKKIKVSDLKQFLIGYVVESNLRSKSFSDLIALLNRLDKQGLEEVNISFKIDRSSDGVGELNSNFNRIAAELSKELTENLDELKSGLDSKKASDTKVASDQSPARQRAATSTASASKRATSPTVGPDRKTPLDTLSSATRDRQVSGASIDTGSTTRDAWTVSVDTKGESESEATEFPKYSYKKHVEETTHLLKGLATAKFLEFSGDPIDYDTYLEDAKASFDELSSKYDVQITDGTLTVKIPAEQAGKEYVLEQSYDEKAGCPKVTLTNPPDDHSIIVMLEVTRNIMPLRMKRLSKDSDTEERSLKTADTVLRLLEASIIAGSPIILDPEDESLLEDNKRFQYLNSLLSDETETRLEEFRKHASEQAKWEFGKTDIPKDFYDKMPPATIDLSGSERPKRDS